MIVEYNFEVSKEVTIDPKFKHFFGRLTVPYGRYRFRFNAKQVNHERDVQSMLKSHPEIRGELKIKTFEE
jgi:hypothetical protein